jgi:hypothetical protein
MAVAARQWLLCYSGRECYTWQSNRRSSGTSMQAGQWAVDNIARIRMPRLRHICAGVAVPHMSCLPCGTRGIAPRDNTPRTMHIGALKVPPPFRRYKLSVRPLEHPSWRMTVVTGRMPVMSTGLRELRGLSTYGPVLQVVLSMYFLTLAEHCPIV